MEKLTDKQRQIIRLAFSSRDPELRRQAVERVLTARYTQEFKDWANGQGAVFTHPETNNQVRFNSLPSQSQKEVYRRWKGGEYENRGGPAAGAGDEEGRGEGAQRGGDYANRTELRGKPKKKMEDKAGVDDDDLGRMLPLDKINRLQGDMGDRIKEGLRNASFTDLESIHISAKYMAENPDDEYTKNHWLSKHAKLNNNEMKTLYKALGKKLEAAKGRKYGERSLQIANRNSLEGVDADAIYDFRKAKPLTGRKLTPEQLKQKFLQGPWADAETKERVRNMSPDEFMAMRNSIFDEDEDELDFGGEGQGRQASEKLRLFERPPSAGEDKEASLSEVGRRIVRMAYHSKDPEVRRKLVRRARAELGK